MSDSLTTLTTKIRAQLGDDGSLYPTGTCTAAVREALMRFNEAAPMLAATLVEVVPGQREYALNEADFAGLLDVIDVMEYDALAEDHRSLSFMSLFEDNAPFIRLTTPLSRGQLLVQFTLPHSVNGLDGSVESTLTQDQDQVLVDGACARAAHVRAVSRTETINLAPEVVEHHRLQAAHFEEEFQMGLKRYQSRTNSLPFPNRGWEDEWSQW